MKINKIWSPIFLLKQLYSSLWWRPVLIAGFLDYHGITIPCETNNHHCCAGTLKLPWKLSHLPLEPTNLPSKSMKAKNSRLPGTISLIVNPHKTSFFFSDPPTRNQWHSTRNIHMLDGQTSPVFCFHPYPASHNHGNRKWPYCKGNRSWGNQDPLWEEEPCFQSNENPYRLGGQFFCWILSQNLAATLPHKMTKLKPTKSRTHTERPWMQNLVAQRWRVLRPKTMWRIMVFKNDTHRIHVTGISTC